MIVIIGLGTAAVYATRWITSLNRDEEIAIIEKHEYESYSPCGIPLIFEKSGNFNDLKHPFPRTKRIQVYLNYMAERIDPNGKKVFIKNLKTGEEKEIGYDKLLFASGADPFIPPIKNAREYVGKGVFVVKTLEDAENIEKYISTGVKNVAVIGAGAIGLEMAYALKVKGLNVQVFEMFPQVFPRALDQDMAKIVQDYLESSGIKVNLNARVNEIVVENGKIRGIETSNGRYDAEMVILATGVSPNTKILEGMVKMERGYIVVNERMQTSREDIYAAGDCVIVKNFVDSSPFVIQLATTAAKQGIVAGINLAGRNAIYSGALGNFVSVIGDLEVSAVGLTESYFANKMKVVSARGKTLDKPEYAGGREITMKIVCDENGKVLGAQAIGRNASREINVIALAIKAGLSAQDLSALETAYCPAVSDLYSIINLTADLILRKINPSSYIF